MTRLEMISKLKGYIYSNYKNASDYAVNNGFSNSFVSAVIVGKKNPTKKMLDDIGLEMKKETIVSFLEK